MNKIFRDIRFKTNQSKSYLLMDLNRRSTKDVFEMKMKIQDKFLAEQCKENTGIDTKILEAQLNILRWVLNDTSI